LERTNWASKLAIFAQIFKRDLKQVSYNNSFVVFGMPIMAKTCVELDMKLDNHNESNFNIDAVQFYTSDRVNNFQCMNYTSYKSVDQTRETDKIRDTDQTRNINKVTRVQSTEKKAPNIDFVFVVRPDIQDDIYHLYASDKDGKEVKSGTAHIPDFTTSVMMNKIFRIIKENDNLDALEESDDEEEFENENACKFVKLDMSQKMICKYNYKFKRWTPVRIAPENAVPILLNELNNITKIYEQKDVKRYKRM
jgi:hypothetical protein